MKNKAIENFFEHSGLHKEARSWLSRGACVDVPTRMFYPQQGAAATELIEAAKTICSVCEVRRECLTLAMKTGEQHGVWGGLDPLQRAKLTRLPV